MHQSSSMMAGSHLCRRKQAGTGPADTSLTSLASCWCSVASAALTAGSQAGGPWASSPLGAAPAAGCDGSSAPLGAADSASPAGPWLACCACCERGLPMPGDAGVPEAARLCPLGDDWTPCARPRSAAAAVPPPAAPLHSCVLIAVSPKVQHLRPRHAARPHSGIARAGAGAALLRRTGAQPLGSRARPRAARCCTARCLHSMQTIMVGSADNPGNWAQAARCQPAMDLFKPGCSPGWPGGQRQSCMPQRLSA